MVIFGIEIKWNGLRTCSFILYLNAMFRTKPDLFFPTAESSCPWCWFPAAHCFFQAPRESVTTERGISALDSYISSFSYKTTVSRKHIHLKSTITHTLHSVCAKGYCWFFARFFWETGKSMGGFNTTLHHKYKSLSSWAKLQAPPRKVVKTTGPQPIGYIRAPVCGLFGNGPHKNIDKQIFDWLSESKILFLFRKRKHSSLSHASKWGYEACKTVEFVLYASLFVDVSMPGRENIVLHDAWKFGDCWYRLIICILSFYVLLVSNRCRFYISICQYTYINHFICFL